MISLIISRYLNEIMPKKILILEDEEILLDLLRRKLTKEGYEVLAVQNGEDGLEVMKKKKPDLVLLDIIMPGKNGFEVMEAMQKDEELNKIPIIIISNSGQPVELDKAKKLGVKDWLVKTEFDPREVLEKVRRQLGEQGSK